MQNNSDSARSANDAASEIRKRTGWSFAECSRLLSDCQTYENAISQYEHLRSSVLQFVVDLKRAKMEVEAVDFWLADFFHHNTEYLDTAKNPYLNRWGKNRKKLDDLLDMTALDSYESMKEIYGFFGPGRLNYSWVSNLLWALALDSGRIPRFEPDWLREIKEDPMCKLRILRSPNVVKNVFLKNARWIAQQGDLESTAKYISETISQAEQYFIAASKVDLRVSPLLLYYAATSLIRAVLAFCLQDLPRNYKGHGLQYDIDNTVSPSALIGLNKFRVLPTKITGLFGALNKSYPQKLIEPQSGPWSLIELLRLVPELSSTLEEFCGVTSKCTKIVNYYEHTTSIQASNSAPHFAVSYDFLVNCGFRFDGNTSSANLVSELARVFPQSMEHHRRTEPAHDPLLRSSESLTLGKPLTLISYQYRSLKIQDALFPLLFNGGTDGNWYLVYNNDRASSQQLTVIMALLYGMSMLVRYKPIEWAEIVSGSDEARDLIDEFSRVCLVKLPALATEEILHRKLLGSTEQIPR